MFIFIRFIIVVFIEVLINCIMLYFKKTVMEIKNVFVNLLIVVVLVFVSAFCPFEDLFFRFDTPQKAFRYTNSNKSKIELIVSGNESDFVVAEDNGSNVYLIVPKDSTGWKIGLGYNTRMVAQEITKENIIVYVYQYGNTNDYYVTIFNANGGITSITDDYETEFFSTKKRNESLDKTFVTYYGYIYNITSQYSFKVNGKNICIRLS